MPPAAGSGQCAAGRAGGASGRGAGREGSEAGVVCGNRERWGLWRTGLRIASPKGTSLLSPQPCATVLPLLDFFFFKEPEIYFLS